jgi:hypothetical protein
VSDGVLLTRFFAFVIVGWPILAVSFVYLARRSSIARTGVYFLKSIAFAYAVSLLGPVVMLALFFAVGLVPEVATFYTIVLGVPLFLILPGVAALRVAYGESSE